MEEYNATQNHIGQDTSLVWVKYPSYLCGDSFGGHTVGMAMSRREGLEAALLTCSFHL
jgi:hypothetical protein